jgi:hypothetical protein
LTWLSLLKIFGTRVDSDLFKNAILSDLSEFSLKKIATMYGQWILAGAVLLEIIATMYASTGDPASTHGRIGLSWSL